MRNLRRAVDTSRAYDAHVFRLFGFDVRVRTGFLMFMALIVFINPNRFGVWLAISLAGFTLLHEFGHAVAARSVGAEAAISLDFMAGYTSFRPRQPLTRPQRALISVAGPASQIAVSTAILLAMGVTPWSRDSALISEAAYAIWWAGPVVGVLNLIPVLPLDGGHLAQTGLEGLLRRSALREMAIASLVVTGGSAIALAVFGHTGFTLFIAFLLLGQFQLVQATSPNHRPRLEQAMHREGALLRPTGTAPSAWQIAHDALASGDAGRARNVILADLTAPAPMSQHPGAWVAEAPVEAVQSVLDVLPPQLPSGNPVSELIMLDTMFRAGQARRAGEHAATEFGSTRRPLLAAAVARAANQLGDRDNALLWVNAAIDAVADRPSDRPVLAAVLDHAPEFAALQSDPAFRTARARV